MRRIAVAIVVFSLSVGGCSSPASSPDSRTTDSRTTDSRITDSSTKDTIIPADYGPCVDLPTRFDQDYVLKRGCYYAKQTPVIAAAVRITMQPGVKIIFSQDVGLSFSADQVLIASGTASDPILFTGAQQQRGFWKGVAFDGTLKTDSRLDYVTVEYGGSTTAANDKDAAGVKLTADSRGVRASLTHTTIRESQGWGLWMGGSAVVSEFGHNVFTRNTLGPACLNAEVVGVLDDASTYSGNDRDQLLVKAYRLSKAATWAAIDVPYFLETGLDVEADWTIAPGATLIMAKDAGLTISGDAAALIANGTAAKPIRFTGAASQRGAWNGITFNGSNNTRNVLSNATVEYGGDTTHDKDAACVKLTGDSHGVQFKMSQTTLKESQGWGLYLTGSAVVPQFEGNTVTQNTLGPVSADSNAIHQSSLTSTYSGNDVDRVVIRGQWASKSVTWEDLKVPYLLEGSLRPNNAVLTIAPGVTLIMGQAAWIQVAGNVNGFHAVGTSTKRITITGLQQTAGYWESIVFDTTLNSANALDYCTIEYGGGGGAKGWGGMILTTSDSQGVTLSLTNSKVQHSAVCGLSKLPSSNVTLTDTTFDDNASGDICQP